MRTVYRRFVRIGFLFKAGLLFMHLILKHHLYVMQPNGMLGNCNTWMNTYKNTNSREKTSSNKSRAIVVICSLVFFLGHNWHLWNFRLEKWHWCSICTTRFIKERPRKQHKLEVGSGSEIAKTRFPLPVGKEPLHSYELVSLEPLCSKVVTYIGLLTWSLPLKWQSWQSLPG